MASEPDPEQVLKNKATFLIYWFCASDEKLLDKLLKGDYEQNRQELERLGIPSKYVVDGALETLREEEDALRSFKSTVMERCHPEPCKKFSLSDLITQLILCVFGSRK